MGQMSDSTDERWRRDGAGRGQDPEGGRGLVTEDQSSCESQADGKEGRKGALEKDWMKILEGHWSLRGCKEARSQRPQEDFEPWN